jgi:phosphohistidine phosphatase
MRHGDAMQSGEQSLTEKGRAISQRMAEAILRLDLGVPQAIYASPLVRAQQTAQIVKSVLAPSLNVKTTDAVASGNIVDVPMSLIALLSKEHRSLMLIGHDPLMSRLASALITGTDQIVLEMSKSAVAVIELTRFEVPRMRGILRAFLPPEIVS